MDLITVTKEDMARAATSSWGTGYVQEQVNLLREIGINTSEPGWLQNMVGKVYRYEWWDRFVAAGDERRKVKYAQEGVPLEAGPVKFLRKQEAIRTASKNRDAAKFLKRHRKYQRIKQARHRARGHSQITPASPIKVHETTTFVSKEKRDQLFADPMYRIVRAAVLRKAPWCVLCGRKPPAAVLNVDHIVPLTVDWNRRMDPTNLQVLCEDCNVGKSNYWT